MGLRTSCGVFRGLGFTWASVETFVKVVNHSVALESRIWPNPSKSDGGHKKRYHPSIYLSIYILFYTICALAYIILYYKIFCYTYDLLWRFIAAAFMPKFSAWYVARQYIPYYSIPARSFCEPPPMLMKLLLLLSSLLMLRVLLWPLVLFYGCYY